MTQKLVKLKKNTDHNHSNIYITRQEFNKLTAESFDGKPEILASNDDIDEFLGKPDFDDKLKNLTN